MSLESPGSTFRLDKERKQTVSWWQTAPVEGFYARCAKERAERMVGSQGERWVSAGSINVLFDANRRRKEFNP